MREKYMAGGTMAKVAREYGSTHEVVRQMFKKYGFQKNERPWDTPKRRAFFEGLKFDASREVLVSLYVEQKMTIKGPGTELGTSENILRRI
jgi:hypothetical protein